MLATPREWTHDPWSGDVADGFVWGRGALDMKSQTAAEVAAAAALARDGLAPRRAATCSSCASSTRRPAARWARSSSPRSTPTRCAATCCSTRAAANFFEYDGRRLYGVCCAEKGVFRFTLTTDGVAGHASIPRMGDNALLKMGPLLERLAARQPSYDLTDEPRAFLAGLGEDPMATPPRRSSASAPTTRAWRCCSSRCSASPSCRRGSAPRRRST